MDRSRSASTCTASSSSPRFLALSTCTSVAVGQTALSMTTRGVFIRITSFSYSSSHSIAAGRLLSCSAWVSACVQTAESEAGNEEPGHAGRLYIKASTRARAPRRRL
uniref:Uncharacterized protein n=1 Tax=Zea mays TaxID=4577 RepID=C4J3T9_MAIZE|nr:unknown [Zea mays]ACR37395.1 unknown [Zea mays]